MRLDKYIFETFELQSRNKAMELIKEGKVIVDGKTILKPSFLVEDSFEVKLNIEQIYVSRSANKLKFFLEEIEGIDLSDLSALDIGSSTGGFTQILLEYGVKSVTCVDVGSNQLHESLKDDKRIDFFENTDIREFLKESDKHKKDEKRFEIVTCDVSFISLNDILEDIDRLSLKKIIILFKPQFEVGRGVKRDSNGVVKNLHEVELATKRFETNCLAKGWVLLHKSKSQVKGKKGNIEELFYFEK